MSWLHGRAGRIALILRLGATGRIQDLGTHLTVGGVDCWRTAVACPKSLAGIVERHIDMTGSRFSRQPEKHRFEVLLFQDGLEKRGSHQMPEKCWCLMSADAPVST